MISKDFLKTLFIKNKTIIFLIFFVQLFLNYLILSNGSFNINDGLFSSNLGFIVLVIFLITDLILIPLNFGFLKNKKAVDTFFALPINRSKIANTLILFTFLEILIFCLPLTLLSLFFVVTKEVFLFFKFLIFVVMFAISLFAFIIPFIFIFNKCNHIVDGTLIVIGYFIAPYFLIFCLFNLLGEYVLNLNFDFVVEKIFNTGILTLFNLIYISTMHFNDFGSNFYFFVVLIASALIFYFLFMSDFKKTKVENVEQISDHILTYPFLINITTIALLLQIKTGYVFLHGIQEKILMFIIIFVFFAVANFIFKRKILLDIKIILNFGVLCLVSFLVILILINTKAFRISYIYPKEKNISLNYQRDDYYIDCRLMLDDNTSKELKAIYDEENDYFYKQKSFSSNKTYVEHSKGMLNVSYFSNDEQYLRSLKFYNLNSDKIFSFLGKILKSDMKENCNIRFFKDNEAKQKEEYSSIDGYKNPKEIENFVKKYFNGR